MVHNWDQFFAVGIGGPWSLPVEIIQGMHNTPFKTRGLIAAPFTAFGPSGELDLNPVRAYADCLSAAGVVGAFICGTTGEGPSLTAGERLEVASAWVEAAPPSLRVIVHVGHNSLPEAMRLAAHAQAIGADAVACMPPYFFKPSGIGQVVDWCERVAGSAPELPFYYYHIPSMSGVDLPMAAFLPVAVARIPNFVGIKYTYEDLEDYAHCLRMEDGRFDILFGRDELLLSALQLGAEGAVGSTYNFAAPLFRQLMRSLGNGDVARAQALQREAVCLIDICVNGPWHPIAAFKWLFGRVAVDCGAVRPPIPALGSAEMEQLSDSLKDFLAGDLLLSRQGAKLG